MELGDVANKEQFFEIVINELKRFGVKYQKPKKKKHIPEKPQRKNIFRTQLHLLELTDVILANGRVVQIPKFVAEACNRILEQVETEGIFRKAGSFVRQKEIRISIESGIALGKSHHVIDVANVIKYFFRELPEPLIPTSIQETLLRGLLVGENCIKSILLSCLLLPPITINTLSFFMQFLYTVSLSEGVNKMTVENLAIIFTPGLMPFPDINSHRFKNHVKIIRILIENSNLIGIIPRSIENKLQAITNMQILTTNSSDQCTSAIVNTFNENCQKGTPAKKKKKRRSEMFNGLKKIVGSAMGSSEFLDISSHDISQCKTNEYPKKQENNVATPYQKEKKRKHDYSNSTKKKGDIITELPNSSAEFLAITPTVKESKKSRLSLGGGRHIKNISLNPVVTSMERRWSIVGSGWSKTKTKTAPDKKSYTSNNCILDIKSPKEKKDMEIENEFTFTCTIKNTEINTDKSICIKDSQMECENIKDNREVLERNMSNKHIVTFNSEYPNSSDINTDKDPISIESTKFSPTATEHLTQRLRRELTIRRSVDQNIMRSPNARKIGSMRQRSQDKKHLSRNTSWHIHVSNGQQSNDCVPFLGPNNLPDRIDSTFFYVKNKKNCLNDKPNTLSSNSMNNADTFNNENLNEQWMSGEEFFSDNQLHIEHVTTPVSRKKYFDEDKTPMLPPKSLPRKFSNARTPLNTAKRSSTTSKIPFVNRVVLSTPVVEEVSGRASIARLRAQNAGMVMAKAKLFDGLGNSNNNEQPSSKKNSNPMELNNKIKSVNSNQKNNLSFKQNEIDTLEIKTKPTLKGTPIAKRIQNSNLNSPTSSLKRRQRGNATKKYNKQIVKSIVFDEQLSQCNDRVLTLDNKVTLKQSINCRSTKSPRRVIKRNRQHLNNRISSSDIHCRKT